MSLLHAQRCEPQLVDTPREQKGGLDLIIAFPADTVHRSQKDEEDTLSQEGTVCPAGSTALAQELSFRKYSPSGTFFQESEREGES